MKNNIKQIVMLVTACFAGMTLRGDKIVMGGTISSATTFTKAVTSYWSKTPNGAVGTIYDIAVPPQSKAVIKVTIHPGTGSCNLCGGVGYAFVGTARYSLGTRQVVTREYSNPYGYTQYFQATDSTTPMQGGGFTFGVCCSNRSVYNGSYSSNAAVQDSFKVEVTYEKIYADLVPLFVSINGTTFSNKEIVVPENTAFKVSCAVKNVGELGGSASLAKLYLDNVLVASQNVQALTGGSSVNSMVYEVANGFSGEGPHTFKLVVDSDDVVSESNEANNELVAQVSTPYLTLTPPGGDCCGAGRDQILRDCNDGTLVCTCCGKRLASLGF